MIGSDKSKTFKEKRVRLFWDSYINKIFIILTYGSIKLFFNIYFVQVVRKWHLLFTVPA